MAVTSSDDSPAPLLVLEQVERDPKAPSRLAGTVRFAGHRLRVVLDFGRHSLGVVEYVDVPRLLGMHEPSLGAVISAMTRIEEGEAVTLPSDLTREIIDSDPSLPL